MANIPRLDILYVNSAILQSNLSKNSCLERVIDDSLVEKFDSKSISENPALASIFTLR